MQYRYLVSILRKSANHTYTGEPDNTLTVHRSETGTKRLTQIPRQHNNTNNTTVYTQQGIITDNKTAHTHTPTNTDYDHRCATSTLHTYTHNVS